MSRLRVNRPMNINMNIGNSYMYRQQMKAVHSAQRATQQEAQSNRARQRSQFEDLEDQISRLKLVCESMWELMSQVTGLTAEQLEQRIHEVDLDDGQADGRKVHAAAMCTQCESMIPSRSKVCTYCSAPAPSRGPFAF
jgi:hypothetical protein